MRHIWADVKRAVFSRSFLLAALFHEVWPDLSQLHQVGQHAMDEIYLSWQNAVDGALSSMRKPLRPSSLPSAVLPWRSPGRPCCSRSARRRKG